MEEHINAVIINSVNQWGDDPGGRKLNANHLAEKKTHFL